MFELTLITTDGTRVYPRYVSSFMLKQSFDTPADSLTAVIVADVHTREYAQVELRVAGELVFCGFVDEERHSVSDGGHVLTIIARSIAAVLLDNEACPQTFYHMTLDELRQHYLEPCRITNIVCDKPVCVPQVIVRKGMSVYELCDVIAVAALLEQPRVVGYDTIDFTGGGTLAPVLFSNAKAGGTVMSGVTKRIRRCEVLSDIIIQSPDDGLYRSAVINRYAWNEYLRRTRYYIPPSEWQIMPGFGAGEMIRESMLRRFAIEITTPSLTIHPLFAPARVDADGMREHELFIAEKRMVLDGDGLHTDYVLREERFRQAKLEQAFELHHLI